GAEVVGVVAGADVGAGAFSGDPPGPPAVELLRALGVGDVPEGIDQLFVHVIFEPAPDTAPPCRDPHGMGPAHRRDRRTSCIRYATGSGIHRGHTPAMQGAPKVDVHAGPMNENRSQEAVPSHSEAVTRRQRARRRVKRITAGIAGVAMAVTAGTAGLAAADSSQAATSATAQVTASAGTAQSAT